MNAIWSMVMKSLMRNVSRNLLQASLIFFSAFAMAYFAQFLAGVTKNYTDNLVHLASGHIYISSQVNEEDTQNLFDREYDYLSIPDTATDSIKALPYVSEVNPRIEFQARISLPDDMLIYGVSAFDPDKENRLLRNFTMVEGRIFQGDKYEVVLPADLARRYFIKVGDMLPLLAQTSSKKMNLVNFKVVGFFETATLSAWFNNYMYTNLDAARLLLNDKNVVTRVNIHLKDVEDKELAMSEIKGVLDSLPKGNNPPITLTWWEDGAAFFTSLVFGIESGFFIIVGIICTILACSIGFATVMGVIERTKEIATLGALGAPPNAIRKIFIMENVLLSDLASLLGIGVAAIGFLITVKYGIPIHNPQLQGFLGASRFYPANDPAGFIVPFLICKFVTASVSYIVAGKASRTPITEALADR